MENLSLMQADNTSPRYPENSALLELPKVGEGGTHYQCDSVTITLYPVGTSEYYCISPMESVIFPLGPPQKWASAFDSDKLVTECAIPNNLGYCLKGAQIYSVNLEQRPTSHHLTVSFLPSFRQAIEEDLGDASASLRTATNLIPRLSSSLLIAQIRDFLNNGFMGGRLVAESLANLAVIQGLHALSHKVPKIKHSKLNKESLARTLEFIEANLDHNIGLKDIAQSISMSVYHFARCFKDTTGLTPGTYVMERRIARAKVMLENGGASLMDITISCGLSSRSHLSRLIKHHTGMSPLRYRKMFKAS